MSDRPVIEPAVAQGETSGATKAEDVPPVEEAAPRSPMKLAFQRFRRDKFSVAALVVLAAIVCVGLLADVLAPHDPLLPAFERLQSPSTAHLLGTDQLGRDILSRLLHGTQLSMSVGFVAVAIGLTFGTTLGVVAGYVKRLDAPIMRVVDVVLAFPSVLLALAVVAVLGPGLWKAMVAVGLANVPNFARLARSQVLGLKNQQFIQAALLARCSSFRILRKHLLPNCVGVLTVYSTLRVGQAVIIAATLGFLGLGAVPPEPEWGVMVSGGRQYLAQAPFVVLIPSAAIFVVVLCANVLGDGLRDALDPKRG